MPFLGRQRRRVTSAEIAAGIAVVPRYWSASDVATALADGLTLAQLAELGVDGEHLVIADGSISAEAPPVAGGAENAFSLVRKYGMLVAYLLEGQSGYQVTSPGTVWAGVANLWAPEIATYGASRRNTAASGALKPAITYQTSHGLSPSGAMGCSMVVGAGSTSDNLHCRLGGGLQWQAGTVTSTGPWDFLQLEDPSAGASNGSVCLRVVNAATTGEEWELVHTDGATEATVIPSIAPYDAAKDYEMVFLVDGGVRIHWALREAGVEDATIADGVITTNIPAAGTLNGIRMYAGLVTTASSGTRSSRTGPIVVALKNQPWGATL